MSNAQGHALAQPTPISVAPYRKAVNIIAMGSSREDFFQAQMMEMQPEMLKDSETWTINYMGSVIPCDRVIHVDPVHPYTGHPPIKRMLELTKKMGTPIYTSCPHPQWDNHVLYPFEKVLAYCGMPYFNTSVAYAVVLAMMEGYNEIGLFGCDFSYPNVHVSESGRACVEFWMGWGSQRGVRFAVSKHSTLLDMSIDQQPYGFFADPMVPPNNGGRLMSTNEILGHIRRLREPVRSPIIPLSVPVSYPINLVAAQTPKSKGNGLDVSAVQASQGPQNAPSNIQLSNNNG